MINPYIYKKIFGDALILPIAFSQTEQIRLLINVDEKNNKKDMYLPKISHLSS